MYYCLHWKVVPWIVFGSMRIEKLHIRAVWSASWLSANRNKTCSSEIWKIGNIKNLGDVNTFIYLLGHLLVEGPDRHIIWKKVREKSRECHNYKPKPFPDTKRKRKPTNLNKHKPNKRTKSTKISSLFPKRGNRNTKRTKNHKNKMTHGKTYNKSPRRINHKATRSKTNTGTTALERSESETIFTVVQLWRIHTYQQSCSLLHNINDIFHLFLCKRCFECC